jgi:hypothetical protein
VLSSWRDRDAPDLGDALARFLICLAAIGFIATYVVVAWLRLRYPFELEWMEGGAVDHVRRVLSGIQLYVPPSAEFTPFFYTPLYWWVSAGVSSLTGLGFFPLRLVSFVASLVSIALIFLIVRRETRAFAPSLLAAGLFAACFRLTGAWLDLARVDSLFMALVLVAVFLLRSPPGAANACLSALVFAAAVFTKQTALVILLPVAVAAVATGRRWALLSLAAAFSVLGLAVVVLDRASNLWFSYYVLDLPNRHRDRIAQEMYVRFWRDDLARPLGIALLLAVLFVAAALRADWKRGLFWVGLLGGSIAAAWRSRLHFGGYDNVLLPAVAALAILAGLATALVLERARALGGWRRSLLGALSVAVVLGQFALLAYEPRAQIPSARDRAAGEGFLKRLADIPGDVFVPFHGFLPSLAGKKSSAHVMALLDVLRGGGDEAVALQRDLDRRVSQRRWTAIVLDDEREILRGLEPAYRRAGRVFDDPEVFFPVTGHRTRPSEIYVLDDVPGSLGRKD